MIMIKQYFRFMCLFFGIAGIVGCSNNGFQPISLDSEDNSIITKVGTTGASFVSQCANFTLAVSKDETWPNGAHKIFLLAGTTWTPLSSYSSIDAWKVAYDQHSGLLWVIARDKTLWKGLEQQVFDPSNNEDKRTGPIIAYDLSLAQTEDFYGAPCALPFILLNETGTYGYVIWRFLPSIQKWGRYYGTVQGSGVAIAANPNPPSYEHGGDMWVVRNNGELWLWNCSNNSWVKKASNCQSTFGKADVSVAGNEYVYYLKNTATGFNYYIAVSGNHGDSWTQSSYGRYLGATDKGWSVHYSGSIYKHISGSTWQLY
jgi:hypothetical protein